MTGPLDIARELALRLTPDRRLGVAHLMSDRASPIERWISAVLGGDFMLPPPEGALALIDRDKPRDPLSPAAELAFACWWAARDGDDTVALIEAQLVEAIPWVVSRALDDVSVRGSRS